MPKIENKAAFETTDLWMLLTTMVWAVNLSLIKFSLREFTPHGFNGVRLALSAAIFLVVLAFRRGGFSLGRGDFLKVAGWDSSERRSTSFSSSRASAGPRRRRLP